MPRVHQAHIENEQPPYQMQRVVLFHNSVSVCWDTVWLATMHDIPFMQYTAQRGDRGLPVNKSDNGTIHIEVDIHLLLLYVSLAPIE